MESGHVAAALTKVLGSQPFRGSERRRKLLQFLVEEALAGRAGELKERVVGVEVFERDPCYDVRVDPITRVEMGRLRAKLLEYYATEGAGDDIIIDIPKGGYAPRLIVREPAAVPSQPPAPARRSWVWAAAAILILGLAGAVVAVRYRPYPVHKPDPEAESLYLKGRYYWAKRSPDSLHAALDLFTRAIVRDPAYAKPYVGMADCYNLLREFAAMPEAEAFSRARAAARRAVQIDPHSAEAHASLAFSSFWGAWDLAGAEREFQRAISLDPSCVMAHHWYATALSGLGRYDEALAQFDRAQQLDPSSNAILADKGFILFCAGHREQGLALLKELEASEPDFLSPRHYLAEIYFQTGDDANYLVEARRAAELSQDDHALAVCRAAQAGFDSGGRQGMMKSRLQAEIELYDRGLFPAYSVAATCARAGRGGQTVQYLQAALARHESSVLVMGRDPAFSGLRDDPSYRTLLAQVARATGEKPR